MKGFVGFFLLAFCFLAVIVLAIIADVPSWSYFIPAGLGLIGIMMLLRGIVLPARTVTRGMELIQAQDYNNRLVKVGEPNADRVVTLFNSLIDKLRSERLLNREQESLLKLLINASPMGVMMLDFNNQVSLVNSSMLKILGLRDNIIGKKFKDLKGEIIKEMLKVPLGKSTVIRKTNNRIFRCYHLSFIQEGFKREFYLLESLTDEIMKAEKAAYEKVIRTISHEVNNSIGGVRGVLEVVEDIIDNDEIKTVIRSCDNRCERMCRFLSEYAEVVKIPDPVLRRFDINHEIEMMIPFLLRMLPKNVSLDFNSSPSPAYILGDAAQLQQVVMNVFKNAVESITSVGKVEISVGVVNEGVKVIIADNGAAISEEVAGQLFSPFFTTKPDGKGIGLTFVREVLSRHEAIYSLSTDEDNITRFSIIFK